MSVTATQQHCLIPLFDWDSNDEPARAELLRRPAARIDDAVRTRVAGIIERVRLDGDTALRELTAELDGVELDDLTVDEDEFEQAALALDKKQVAAIELAVDQVTRYHAAQQRPPLTVETLPGVRCERVLRPIQAVGLYVPAGTAPLPSTAIMLAVPARLAACPLRVLVTPPRKDGRADPAVVTAALMCGVERIYKVGGAQAIAALACGTKSIPRVDKIFGPGNAWVAAAKQAVSLASGGPAIDLPAGPSELMVLADAGADPAVVAADLLSQAEHGPDSQVFLVTTSPTLRAAVAAQLEHQANALPRAATAKTALARGALILVRDTSAAVAIANRYAPEHLSLQLRDASRVVDDIVSAGAVFVGPWTPESVGDYSSGSNHVLPTGGSARACSGLGLADFQRTMSVQTLNRQGLVALADATVTLARMEGLEAHARAVLQRMDRLSEESGP